MFISEYNKPFSHVNYSLIDESTSNEIQLSQTERNSLLEAFEYPLTHFEVPAWDSYILNSLHVRKRLADCEINARSASLEIRKNSVVITDFLKHRIDVFYSLRNLPMISNGKVDPLIFSSFLHDFDAVMIHCSCVSFYGRAAVFLAMDEGGKTTAVSLCKGGRVLADDQIIFRKQDDDSWLAYGTPWTTFPPDLGNAIPAAFFLLEKADEFSLTKLGSLELLAHLWNEHHKVRLPIPKFYHTKIMDLYRGLSSSAPVYLMKFSKDHIDQEAILKCMKQ